MGPTRRAHGAAPAGQVDDPPGRLRPGHGPAQGAPARHLRHKRAAVELARSVAVGRVGSADETVETFVVEVWLKSKEGRVEQSTLDQYRWAVERHIVPLIGAIRLRDLSAKVVDGWILDLGTAPEGEKHPVGGDIDAAGAQGAVDGPRGGRAARPARPEPGRLDPAAQAEAGEWSQVVDGRESRRRSGSSTETAITGSTPCSISVW
ncbi:MAG: hypothetical protein ACRD1K_07540 [Acidimicrobiales bacterium]